MLEDLPDLTDPVLILAWEGWNDASNSASTAARYLLERFGGRPFATIDPEEFYDFTEIRPMARYRRSSGERYIDWPDTRFVQLRDGNAAGAMGGRDIVVGIGVEPQLRWKRYVRALSELVETIGAKLILTLGAVGAGTPHTRPVHVRGSANNPNLAERYNMHPSRFEGPSGIVGVFHDHCRRQGVGGVSLWASVPHYVPETNPVGTAALLRVVREMTGLQLDLSPLEREAARFQQKMDELLSEHDDLREYVRQLEAQVPAPPPSSSEAESELPSADALIADLEDFFRQSGSGDGEQR